MNKVALVTGASRGIGAATAIRLAQDGYDIGVNYLENSDTADRVVADIVALGQKAIAIKADVSCDCLLYTSPSPRDQRGSRMPSSA